MSKSKQVRLHVDALPLLDDLQALLVERSYAPVSRAAALRYGVTLAAWCMYEGPRAGAAKHSPLGRAAGGDQGRKVRVRQSGRRESVTTLYLQTLYLNNYQ